MPASNRRAARTSMALGPTFPARGLARMRQALRPVARPHPLRRLIDGRPDDPGRRIARRTTLLMIPAIVGANLTGAVVVFALLVWVLPLPDVDDPDAVVLVNLVAAAPTWSVACVVGTVWGLGRWRATRSWLVRDREPDATSAAPHCGCRCGTSTSRWRCGWSPSSACSASTSRSRSCSALIVAVTTLLGAVTTGAMAYLLAERIMRAASARALASGVPETPVLPGVTTRALLAWALGSGVPLRRAVRGRDRGAGRRRHRRAASSPLSALVLGGVALVVGRADHLAGGTRGRRPGALGPRRARAASRRATSTRACRSSTAATSGCCRPASTA